MNSKKWQQSIQHKLLITLISCFLMLLVIVVSLHISFMRLEQEDWVNAQMGKLTQVTANLIENQFSKLASLTELFAENNDAYRFVESADINFVLHKLNPEYLRHSGIVGALVQDADGHFIEGRSIFKPRQAWPFWDALLTLREEGSTPQYQQGFLTLDKRIYLYVKSPVKDAMGLETPNGTITLIREFDNDDFANISRLLDVYLNIAVAQPKNEVEVYPSLYPLELNAARVYTEDKLLHADFRLNFNPAALEVFSGSLHYAWQNVGMETFGIRIFGAVLVMMLVVVVLLFWLRSQITRPLSALVNHVANADSIAAYQPFDVKREDELGALCQQINQAFFRIQQQHALSRAIFGSVGEAILTVDPQGRVTFVNQAAVNLFGIAEPDLLGQPLEFLLSNQSDEGLSVMNFLHEICINKKHIEQTCLLRVQSKMQQLQNSVLCGHPMKLIDDREDSQEVGAVLIVRAVSGMSDADHETWYLPRPSASPVPQV